MKSIKFTDLLKLPDEKFTNLKAIPVVAFTVSFAFTAVFFNAKSFAEPANLSEDQRGAISQHCATTKQSLRTLQRTDARTRSYLGSAYESLLTNYITPLDLRLINSGQPNSNLINIHSEIIDTRKNFISEYTSYSQALEDLISTDCQSDPDNFYEKLVETRKRRAKVSSTTTTLRNLFSEHLTAVRHLRNSLTGGTDAEL